jgi:colanic acid/amylovoran biosynthesis glycosyltransferase
MQRVLILLTSSFPFGTGEEFVAHELPYLRAAFDELVIVSNDTDSEALQTLPDGVTCLRVPSEPSAIKKLQGSAALIHGEPRHELRRVRAAYASPITRQGRNTVVVSWAKATTFSRLLRRLAQERSGSDVYAYSYWANDMALAAALARRRGWVDRAVCRAHGWDVYFERSGAGLLPFRRYLAEHLDHYCFVSNDGLAYFREREGRDFPSLGHWNLGTEMLTTKPLGRRRPFVVLSCSSMIALKRVERIAEALEHVGRDVTWIHIGDGPWRAAIERVVARLPASVRVELTGPLSNSEVLDTYRQRRPSLFVNLSESEGLPVAIMEAMSAGVPVVATAVGGIAEIVSHRQNGLLLGADPAVADVSAAIDSFAGMPDAEYEAYARSAWATWEREFNAGVNYPRFVRDVLDGPDPDR